jgi:hypothetical protein
LKNNGYPPKKHEAFFLENVAAKEGVATKANK